VLGTVYYLSLWEYVRPSKGKFPKKTDTVKAIGKTRIFISRRRRFNAKTSTQEGKIIARVLERKMQERSDGEESSCIKWLHYQWQPSVPSVT